QVRERRERLEQLLEERGLVLDHEQPRGGHGAVFRESFTSMRWSWPASKGRSCWRDAPVPSITITRWLPGGTGTRNTGVVRGSRAPSISTHDGTSASTVRNAAPSGPGVAYSGVPAISLGSGGRAGSAGCVVWVPDGPPKSAATSRSRCCLSRYSILFLMPKP